MKVFMVDKYYFMKGGVELYFFELKTILERNGHTIIPFSMKHPANFKTPCSDYFVDNIDFNPSSMSQKLSIGMRSLGRIFYSIQAAERLKWLIRDTRPDVAHLHMIDNQFSPPTLPSFRFSRPRLSRSCRPYTRSSSYARLIACTTWEIKRCVKNTCTDRITARFSNAATKDRFLRICLWFSKRFSTKWPRMNQFMTCY
jgi:hypothetical protein